ncbi:MAG: DNA repair protein RecO [Verrucomicrobiota bacterium]|nr:DNA repair protein RecO [Verrucomicrobiota bacterium]
MRPAEKDEGIILRRYKYSETSLIVHWLTPDKGRVKTLAKGAMGPKSVFRGKLDLFYQGEVLWTRSGHSDLHMLKDFLLRETHSTLAKEIRRLEWGAYLVELTETVSEIEIPSPELYVWFARYLKNISMGLLTAEALIQLEYDLLRVLGLEPVLELEEQKAVIHQNMMNPAKQGELLNWSRRALESHLHRKLTRRPLFKKPPVFDS